MGKILLQKTRPRTSDLCFYFEVEQRGRSQHPLKRECWHGARPRSGRGGLRRCGLEGPRGGGRSSGAGGSTGQGSLFAFTWVIQQAVQSLEEGNPSFPLPVFWDAGSKRDQAAACSAAWRSTGLSCYQGGLIPCTNPFRMPSPSGRAHVFRIASDFSEVTS